MSNASFFFVSLMYASRVLLFLFNKATNRCLIYKIVIAFGNQTTMNETDYPVSNVWNMEG